MKEPTHIKYQPNRTYSGIIIDPTTGEKIDYSSLKADGKKLIYQKANKSNKYGARSVTYDGVKYHSTKEGRYAAELDIRLKAKDIKKWERQIRYPLIVNGHKICTYIIDFKITHNDETIEWIEIKGYTTDTARLKMNLFEALKPDGDRFTVIK